MRTAILQAPASGEAGKDDALWSRGASVSPSDHPARQLPARHWLLTDWTHVFLPGKKPFHGQALDLVGPPGLQGKSHVGLTAELPSTSLEEDPPDGHSMGYFCSKYRRDCHRGLDLWRRQALDTTGFLSKPSRISSPVSSERIQISTELNDSPWVVLVVGLLSHPRPQPQSHAAL